MALAGDDVVDDLRRPPFVQGEYAGLARLDVLQGMDEGFIGKGVAPFTGAWIEILSFPVFLRQQPSRTLHGCVD